MTKKKKKTLGETLRGRTQWPCQQNEYYILGLISACSESEVRCIVKQGAGAEMLDHSFNLS